MITTENLTVAWGGFTLLDSINFHLGDGEKIGLVGKNGAGKSTLLKVILGEQLPTHGKVTLSRQEKIGYLPQQMQHAKDKSVLEETLTAFRELFSLHERLDQIHKELNERSDYQSDYYNKLIIEYNSISDRIAVMEDESSESKAQRVLKGLGFKEEDFSRSTATLSQGWNMRIELAKILLTQPDTLLLDEPTNHLDIESIQWFENYLKQYKGSVVLISHDRRFLDNITTRTVEIMLGKLYDYKVPYSKYKILRAQRMEQQRAAFENQQRMIEKSEEFIERFRYKATKSNQVQSRIKQLDKLERIEIDIEDKSVLNVKFAPAPRSGNVVFRCSDATFAYPQKVVLKGVNLTIERGEKVALVGRNGEGKTTLMRSVISQLSPYSGSAELGHNVVVGYYAQNQEDMLDNNDTVWDTLDKIAVGDIRTKLRDILGAFLFKGEDIDKKVAVLSGGEKARLAIAKLMLKPYNLLAFDEPTNHMDIRSKEVLKQALSNYDGTLIIVSHDRDFLDGIVDKVYEFGDGKVREHLGGIEDYLYNLSKREYLSIENSTSSGKNSPSNGTSQDKTEQITDSQNYRLESKLSRKRRKEIEKIENEIAALDEKLSLIEVALTQATEHEKISELSEQYSLIKKNRDDKMDLWLELSEFSE